MTTRRLWSVAALMVLAALSQRPAFAQGDGPRTHWKEMLTDTHLVSLTFLNGSGNANLNDPSFRVVPGANFDAELALVGYSRSFSLFNRTALGSILVPVGELEGEVTGLGPVPLTAARNLEVARALHAPSALRQDDWWRVR